MLTAQPSDREQKKNRIITLILLAILLMSISTFLMQRDDSKTIIVTFPNGTTLETEVADTPEKLLFGLAFQEALPPDGGMIYIFEATGPHRVTTKAYRFPVDMMWVDESHHIVSIAENVAPCRQESCAWHGSTPEAVRYLIQTEAGFVKRKSIAIGEELKFTLRM